MLHKRRTEVDMTLHRFRRQYEQLSQFEMGRIIGMMKAGADSKYTRIYNPQRRLTALVERCRKNSSKARRVTRQLVLSDCVVRKCLDQWIREMRFTRRPVSQRAYDRINAKIADVSEAIANASLKKAAAEKKLLMAP
ncbi:hypothetical protein TNCV_2218291 [Trichonephila clavipes]|nr:hypothetical protein TNCV_2218291 [Trichonephila clavipes]